ncbi:MAG: Arm DNA-binding domain-containing protein [Clostridia bacterium]|jgi:hypothetical protein|nr:Arm DNA-binding domain-containing protein [Clostridia bacterium]
MDGSIYEYEKGGKKRYRVVYRVEVSIGKLKQRQKRGFTTIKAAKEFLTKVQNQLLNGTYIDPVTQNQRTATELCLLRTT